MFDPDIHHRRSLRLRDYDYATDGAYFVTVCVQEREQLFGEIVAGEMVLSDAGLMVEDIWNALPDRYPGIAIDAHVVMPNHFHGIVFIDNACDVVGASLVGAQDSSTDSTSRAGTRPAPTLGDAIGAFKSMTTHAYIRGVEQNNWPPFPGRLWQRNYFERIIRDDGELRRLRDYVAGNPGRRGEGWCR